MAEKGWNDALGTSYMRPHPLKIVWSIMHHQRLRLHLKLSKVFKYSKEEEISSPYSIGTHINYSQWNVTYYRNSTQYVYSQGQWHPSKLSIFMDRETKLRFAQQTFILQSKDAGLRDNYCGSPTSPKTKGSIIMQV